MKKTISQKEINGRRFQLLNMPGTGLFKFEILCKYGSHMERYMDSQGRKLYGIAHFTEHLSFKSSMDFTTDEINEFIKRNGAYNASTSFHAINYWFKTSMEKSQQATRMVCNIALNDLSKLNAAEFETEKKVVMNEAKRYEDAPQNMFLFDSESALSGGSLKNNDNVIAAASDIEKLTIADVQYAKGLLLKGKYTFNIVYDSDKMTEAKVIKMVESELNRFPKQKFDAKLDKAYQSFVSNPKVSGEIKLENSAKQSLVYVALDCVKDSDFDSYAYGYLSSFSSSSFDELIREKNGLTYGFGFSVDKIKDKKFCVAHCDLTKGTEDRMFELFAQAANETYNNFTEKDFNVYIDNCKLKRVMRTINLSYYEGTFGVFDDNAKKLAKYTGGKIVNVDIDKLSDSIMKEVTFKTMKASLKRVRDAINEKKYCYIHN